MFYPDRQDKEFVGLFGLKQFGKGMSCRSIKKSCFFENLSVHVHKNLASLVCTKDRIVWSSEIIRHFVMKIILPRYTRTQQVLCVPVQKDRIAKINQRFQKHSLLEIQDESFFLLTERLLHLTCTQERGKLCACSVWRSRDV